MIINSKTTVRDTNMIVNNDNYDNNNNVRLFGKNFYEVFSNSIDTDHVSWGRTMRYSRPSPADCSINPRDGEGSCVAWVYYYSRSRTTVHTSIFVI